MGDGLRIGPFRPSTSGDRFSGGASPGAVSMSPRLGGGLGLVKARQPLALGLSVIALAACGVCGICGIGSLFNGSDDPQPALGLDAVPTSSAADPAVSTQAAVPAAATPAEKPMPTRTARSSPRPATTTRPPSPKPPPPTRPPDPRYKSCKEVIAAGLGPYRRGVDPEYYWYRDSDRDGWVCER